MNSQTRATQRAARNTYDIYLVGVGGQGVLTIGDLIAEAAFRKNMPVNFFPTKGMAQRGGFVKAQIRLGREEVGPRIPEKGADLVIAMERSEALKAVRYIKPGGDFVLFGHVWPPTDVVLGKAPYPSIEQVKEQVQNAKAVLHYLDPEKRPHAQGVPVPANIYVLGTVLGGTRLAELLPPDEVADLVRKRWKRGMERNVLAFETGLEINAECL